MDFEKVYLLEHKEGVVLSRALHSGDKEIHKVLEYFWFLTKVESIIRIIFWTIIIKCMRFGVSLFW